MTTNMAKVINKETVIPIGIVASIIVILIGALLWIFQVKQIAETNQRDINDLKSQIGIVQTDSRSIFERLAIIETKQDTIIGFFTEEAKKN